MKVVYNEVQVLDKTDNKCRLYAYGEANLNSLECVNTYVCLSQWYKGAIYKVEKIEDNFIYWVSDEIKKILIKLNENSFEMIIKEE